MSEAIGQPGGAALPRPMGIGEILSTAFRLYQRHWRTLLAIAAVVVVPFTLLQYLLGHTVRVTGVATSNGVMVTTSSWRAGLAGLVTALAGVSGLTRNTDQRARGSWRLSAASRARSLGCSRGRGCWRRRTVSS